MNQHEFVKGCLLFYEQEGMTPEEGWEEAHYPAPNGVGTSTIWLTHEHHQIQGLLQSEEYGRCCFFIGHTKQSLAHGPFTSNWFELWDLYYKWAGDILRVVHTVKDEQGRSLLAAKNAEKIHTPRDSSGRSLHTLKLHEDKDELGKSVHSVKIHAERDESGRSVHAVKMVEIAHAKKDESGRSVLGVKNGERLNAEKDESGRSVQGVKNAERQHAQRWQCTHTGFISTPCGLSHYQKARGIDTKNRIRVG